MQISTVTLIVAAALLSSCASKFTPAQLESLSTVAIAQVLVEKDAYSEPDGGDRAAAAMAAQSGVNSGTGALGGLVGSLVGESIAATQNNIFKGKSKQHFASVKSNTPEISNTVSEKLENSLRKDGFFGARLRKSAPSNITAKIHSYGLVRSGKREDGELLLTPSVTIDIHLKDPSGKTLAGRRYIGTGYNHPIITYASNTAETKKGYQLATQTAIDQFTAEVSQKASP